MAELADVAFDVAVATFKVVSGAYEQVFLANAVRQGGFLRVLSAKGRARASTKGGA